MLIKNAKNREKPNTYCEKHHIIPKCLNGSNDITNLVYLTAKEHYVAHHLLCKINPDNCNLFFAFNAMNNWKSRNTYQRYILPNYICRDNIKPATKPSVIFKCTFILA